MRELEKKFNSGLRSNTQSHSWLSLSVSHTFADHCTDVGDRVFKMQGEMSIASRAPVGANKCCLSQNTYILADIVAVMTIEESNCDLSRDNIH